MKRIVKPIEAKKDLSFVGSKEVIAPTTIEVMSAKDEIESQFCVCKIAGLQGAEKLINMGEILNDQVMRAIPAEHCLLQGSNETGWNINEKALIHKPEGKGWKLAWIA